ncbi:MAG: hypothetical protein KF689_12065 [Gemmatimonadaceae bacterium]|nr:hypothetical protein [Gemmatimonadaceae bacterium]MCW5827285.1 hypothetical protein [Gemmatimonadaceae bacterium]
MYIRFTATLCAIGLLLTTSLDAQDSTRSGETAAEARARMARRAAGLLVGPWDLRGITPPNGVEASTMPMITVYLRKGLDARLAMENGVGVWRRVQTTPPTGGLGGTPGEEVQSWVVAQTTNIRFFPATDAGATFEPWLLGGAGFTLGIDDRETSGGGILGGSAGGSGVGIVPGFSLQGGVGAEWWFSNSLALTLGGRYQWTRFLQDFGGERTYQGPVLEAGFTYKFQYR